MATDMTAAERRAYQLGTQALVDLAGWFEAEVTKTARELVDSLHHTMREGENDNSSTEQDSPMTDELDLSKLKVGDRVELKSATIVKSSNDDTAYVQFDGCLATQWISKRAIARVLPRPLQVGDKVTWGSRDPADFV